MQVQAFAFKRRQSVALALSSTLLLVALAACKHCPLARCDGDGEQQGYPSVRSGQGIQHLQELAERSPQEPSPEQADIVRLNLLRQLIDDEILDQRATKLNLAASDEDVNAKLTELKAPYTQEEFDKSLKQQNMTLDDLKLQIRRKLTSDKLINKEIESKINITDPISATTMPRIRPNSM